MVDAEQLDELGLALTRGPFASLDAAKAAIVAARAAPPPESGLASRIGTIRRKPRVPTRPAGGARSTGARTPGGRTEPTAETTPPPPPKPEVRTYRAGDWARLRELWTAVGFRTLGDDDESLDRLAERNPGLLLVAEVAHRIVGTALGAWDGRRGWIYHVAVDASLRRTGLGRRLVHEVERRLRALGCPKVNVIVLDDNPDAAEFWTALGYTTLPARQYGRVL